MPDDDTSIYDLSDTAQCLVPAHTVLVNGLPRHPVARDFPTTQRISFSVSGRLVQPVNETMRAHLFAEMLYALKCAEQGWLVMRLGDDRMGEEMRQAIHTNPLDLTFFQDRVTILVAHDYHGTETRLPDGSLHYTVGIQEGISVRFPIHELMIPPLSDEAA